MYLSVNYIVFTILLYQCLTICTGTKNDTVQEPTGCAIPIPDKGDYESPKPFKRDAATTPTFQFGYVHFSQDEQFSLECDVSQNIQVKKSLKTTNKIVVKCIKEETFEYDAKPHEYKDIKCIIKPELSNGSIITTTPTPTTEEDPYAVAVARHNAGLQDCSILLPDPDYNYMPIPFITNSTPAIIHPNKYGFFTIKAQDEFKLSCADSEFISPVTGVNELTVKCVTTIYLEFNDRKYQFDRFRCKNVPKPKLVVTDQWCQSDNNKIAEVGFQTKSAFLILYKLCFDPIKGYSEYGWYHVYTPMYKLRQVSTIKPVYYKTKNYGKLDVETQYSNQDLILAKILNSKKIVNELIIREDKRFVAKTHLIAKSEFYYAFEKHATYFFENTVPQWYRLGRGVWRDVERVFKRHLVESESRHVIVSGSYLTSTIPDKNGVPHPFYLTLNRQLPVPQYLWKMNYDVNKMTGVVWVGLNNPTTRLNETKFLCEPIVCPTKMQRKTYNKKLMYCCTKESFEQVYGKIDPVVFGDFNTIPPQP